MKSYLLKISSAALAICLALGASGCSFTKTTTSDITETQVKYIDTDGDGVADTPETESGVSSAAPSANSQVGNDKTQNIGSVDSSKEKKLKGTFELQIFSGGYGSEAWEYAIDEFQKLNPDLKITAHLDSNVNTQMKTRWAKDNPPDFVFLDGTDVPTETWMAEGKLLDLGEIYRTGKVYGSDVLIKDHLKKGLTSSYKQTNKIYSMPVILSTYGTWYDSALFTQKGWSVPSNYEELNALCAKIKSSGTSPFIYPGKYSGYLVWGLLMPAVASEAVASGDRQYFYNVANATSGDVFKDERFKSALRKLESLVKAGYFDKSSLSLDHITSQSAWLNHKAAFIPNGLWLENEMKNSIPSGFDMRYIPSLLQNQGKPSCVISNASSVGIAAKGKNTEAAKAFLRFLYTDKVAIKFVELTGSPSATRSDTSSANISASAKQVNQLLSSDKITIIPKGSTTWGSVDTVINNCVNQIVNGETTVDKVCDTLAEATAKKNK